MKEHLVIQLLHKHYTGQLDEQGKDMLSGWLKESPENINFSEQIKLIWDKSASYTPPKQKFEPNLDQALSRFKDNLAKDISENTSENSTVNTLDNPSSSSAPVISIHQKNNKIWKWIAGAAASLLLISSVTYLLQSNSLNGSVENLVTLSGQKEKIQLADQSEFWINEKSTVSYFKSEDATDRIVHLDGEAYFEVSKSDKPFIVRTPNAEIYVLGTGFNVDSDNNRTIVEVKHGKVELKPLNSNQSVVLTDKMIGVYEANNKKLYRKQSKTYNGDAWLTGGISFEDATLEEVFETLEDYFDVRIENINQELLKCVFTSPIYQDSSLKNVLDVMQIIYGFEYEIDEKSKVVKISRGSC